MFDEMALPPEPDKAADIYQRHLDEWAACDELGLNIMVNEHHSTATCLSAACNLILAILARESRSVSLTLKMAGGYFLLAYLAALAVYNLAAVFTG